MPLDSPVEETRKPDIRPSPIDARILAEEICFWQEMLSAMEGADSPQERVERAQQALALARYRLAKVQPLCRH